MTSLDDDIAAWAATVRLPDAEANAIFQRIAHGWSPVPARYDRQPDRNLDRSRYPLTRPLTAMNMGLGFVLAATVIGCTSQPHLASYEKTHHRASYAGYVTGYAAGCGPAHIDMLPVRVTAARDGKIVATRIVRSSNHIGRYRMKLAAGLYLISAGQSGLSPQTVFIRPDQTVIADFKGACS